MKKRNFFPVIGIILFIFIIYKVGPIKIMQTLRNVNINYLYLFFIGLISLVLVKIYKWSIILRIWNPNIKIRELIIPWHIGFFFGLVTPGKIGDLFKINYVNGKKIETLKSIIIDRVMDLLALLFIAIFSAWYLNRIYNLKIPQIVFLIIMVVCFIGVYILFNKNKMRKIFRKVFVLIVPDKYKEKVREVFLEFYKEDNLFKDKKIIIAFCYTFVYWFLCFMTSYYIARALDINIGIIPILIIMPIVTIVEMLPISISGIGTRDVVLIFFFHLYNLSDYKAISFSLLNLFGAVLIAVVGAIFYFRHHIKNTEK